ETDRMTRLVDDLLILAKARRPDFIRPTENELADLTHGLFDKCRALGERCWVLDDAAECVAVVDGQRLTQAVLQFTHNAVRHTTVGDEIGVGSRVCAAGAYYPRMIEFWVRDTGPGVAPGDRDRVFQRFQRGEGTRPDDGFGLGLSIVSAIADAHSGLVVLDPP